MAPSTANIQCLVKFTAALWYIIDHMEMEPQPEDLKPGGGPRILTLKEATAALCLFPQTDLPGERQAAELSPESVSKRISALRTSSAHEPPSPPRKETLP
ncbi:NACHT, LRR and PYD domains-containing protein 5 [Manis javanica]|nr:NACHT, LRR and PYD domains-containing protein 5 [Manis javanica]